MIIPHKIKIEAWATKPIDCRPNLEHVSIEGADRVIATDGMALLVVCSPDSELLAEQSSEPVLVHSTAWKQARDVARATKAEGVNLSGLLPSPQSNGQAWPTWRKVWPAEDPDAKEVTLNASRLKRACEAALESGHSGIRLRVNGPLDCVRFDAVKGGPKDYPLVRMGGLIMPIRP